MSTKRDDPCLKKAGEDEPIFVLRAQDRLAPKVVRQWADAAAGCGEVPKAKIDEARATATALEEWAKAHGGAKWPD